MPKILCPFCINNFDDGELLYHCLDCGKDMKANSLTRREISKKTVACRTPECHGQIVYAKRCPYCNDTLPEAFFEMPNLPFSLIGPTCSGKTSFLAASLHELLLKSSTVLVPATPETKRSFSANNEIVFTYKHSPDLTAPGAGRPNLWIASNASKKTQCLLTIYDGSGITHYDLLEEIAQRDARYLKNSKAAVFVIDPLRFEGLHELSRNIDENNTYSSMDTGPNEECSVFIIENAAAVLRRALNVGANKKLDMSVAVVISKIDLFLNACFSGKTLSKESPNEKSGVFDQKDCDEVDRELTEWLMTHGAGKLVQVLEKNFYFTKSGFKKKKCCLFGVSPFGHAPNADQTLGDVHPHRVIDPLLWLLAQHNYIGTTQ